MPDLAGGSSPDPQISADHNATADTGAGEDAEERSVAAPGAENHFGTHRCLHVVGQRGGDTAQPLGERRTQRVDTGPIRQVERLADGASHVVDLTGGANSDSFDVRWVNTTTGRGFANGFSDGIGHVRRPAGGGCQTPELPDDDVVLVADHSLDLGAAQINSGSKHVLSPSPSRLLSPGRPALHEPQGARHQNHHRLPTVSLASQEPPFSQKVRISSSSRPLVSGANL